MDKIANSISLRAYTFVVIGQFLWSIDCCVPTDILQVLSVKLMVSELWFTCE